VYDSGGRSKEEETVWAEILPSVIEEVELEFV